MATGDDGDAARSDTLPAAVASTAPGAAIAPTDSPHDAMLREGEAVARYRIEGYLGRGGMGVVYRARDPDLDRVLAIKLVRSGSRSGDRVLREAQAMARLDHPNVVPIFDVGVRGEQVFLVMPFLPGGTLGEWCRKTARPWHEVVRRYVEAGRGLEAAHRASLVHRDFKPDNVLIDASGEVHVADFGLARAQRDNSGEARVVGTGPLGDALTQAGELLGTPAYMAPEQLDGSPVDAKADQFSFCVALHEGLYGVRPFELPAGGGLAELRDAIRTERLRQPPAGHAVPSWIRDVLGRGLREAPESRWPSMSELLAELEGGLRRRRRRPMLALAGGAAVAAAAGGIALVAASSSSGSLRTSAPATASGPPIDAPVATLAPRQLTFRGDLELGALAPDDSAVVALAGKQLFVVPLAGGDAKILTRNAEDVHSIAWAPDSKHVMTVSLQEDRPSKVELFDVATGDSEQLSRTVFAAAVMIGPREVASARPTAKAVRFTSLDDDTQSECPIPGEYSFMQSVDLAGGALFVTVRHDDNTISVIRTDRRCTSPRVVIDHRDRSAVVIDADGSHVGVLREIDGARYLERTAVAGGTAQAIPVPDDLVAVIGRTAKGAVVGMRRSVGWQLVRVRGEPARVTDVIGVGSTSVALELSPDGSHIARRDKREATYPVVRVVPTENIDSLPDPIAARLYDFAWSPDGTQIAGLVNEGDESVLVVVARAGGPLRQTRLGRQTGGSLVWLDERRIAFQRDDNRTFLAFDLESQKTEELFDAEAGWTFHLVVNPVDGALALYWNRRDGRGVFVQRPDQKPERVTRPNEPPMVPAWSRDGRALWLVAPTEGTIDRLELRTGKTRRVYVSEPTMLIADVWPQADGSLVTKLERESSDLYVME